MPRTTKLLSVPFVLLVCLSFLLVATGEEFTPCTHRTCLRCALLDPVIHLDPAGLKQLAQDQCTTFKSIGAKLYDFGQCVFCVIPVRLKNTKRSCGLSLNILRECSNNMKCKNGTCFDPKINKGNF